MRGSRHAQNALRHRPRPQPGELPAADAAHLAGARGLGVSRSACDRARPAAAELPRVLRADAPACLGADEARHRARRHGVGGARQHAGDARMPLRRADGGRGAQHHEHAARRRRHRVSARPRRRQGADHRPRIFQGGEGGAGAVQGQAAGRRLRRSGVYRRGRAARQNRIRGFHQGRRSEFRLEHAGRRMGRHRAELHLGHHRRSEGRGLSPPRRASARGQQRADLRDGTAAGLSVDAADVPLQRLVLPLDDLGGGRHPHLSPRGARQGDVRRHRRAQGHAPVRRADRDVDPAQRAGRREKAAAACGAVRDRGRPAAGGGAGGDEGRRLQRHPCLRTDRGLRPRRRQRLESGVGRAAARRTGRQEIAPGRALPHAGRRSTCSTRTP